MKKIYHFVLMTVIISGGLCDIFHKDSVVKVKEETGPGGLWQTKVQWKAHWVRHWEARKIWIPVLRKVWGPVQLKEWIPFPKTPPTWEPPTSTWAPPPHK